MVSVVVTVCYITCTLQMIRKSVETRDWMNTIEPRNVRAVMKRIVEDVTAIDTQVGQLYEEGVRKAHSSGVDRTALFPHTFLCFDQSVPEVDCDRSRSLNPESDFSCVFVFVFAF